MKKIGRNSYLQKNKTEKTYSYYLTNSAYDIKRMRRVSLNENNNDNYFTNFNNKLPLKKNVSFQTKQILEDFKRIIKQTEELKNKIIKSQNNNDNNILIKKKSNLNIKFNDNISVINKEEDSDLGNNIDDILDFQELINNNIKLKEGIVRNNKENIILKNKIRRKKEEEEIKTLKKINIKLGNSNKKLINQNNSLEKKIDDLKNKKNNIINNINNNNKHLYNYYDENLKKFINSLKITAKNNIIENINLSKNIFDVLKQMQLIYNNYNKKYIQYQDIYKIFKKDEKRIKEMNIYDKGKKKLENLKIEQNKLNKQLENFNNNLKQLKTKENILSQKYESNLKSMQDYEELVNKLNVTINNLNNEKFLINRISSVKNIDSDKNKSIDMYEMKVKQLNLIIKSFKNQKHLLMTENYKLKNEIKGINLNKSNEKINLTESELQIKLNKLKIENYQNKKNIEKKEKQIIILKYIINKLTFSIKENNTNDDIYELDIGKIIQDDSNDDEFFKLLKENKINENIKKASLLNQNKMNEIVNITKTYDNLINKKEKEIIVLEDKTNKKNGLLQILEDKVKPLYKKNNISKGNSSVCIKKCNLNINNNIKFDINKEMNNLVNAKSHKNINNIKFKIDYDNIINKNNQNKINPNVNKNKNVKENYNINDKYFGQFQYIKVNKKIK